jgi:hypothetical protein
MNQRDQVVKHVNKWGSINSIEAIRHYGITRLARVIHDLKETKDAMKSVPDFNSSGGFVKYVPDWTSREARVCSRLTETLHEPLTHAGVKAHACLETANALTAIELARRG